MKNFLEKMPVSKLKGVGPKLQEGLQRLGIQTVSDLLFHLPFRYEDRTRRIPIRALKPGDHALVIGDINSVQINQGRRVSLSCDISDSTGHLQLRFFHFSTAQKKILSQPSLKIRCYGEVRWGMRGYEMIHPEYHCFQNVEEIPVVDEKMTPIYPTTEGVNQVLFRKLTSQALQLLHDNGLYEYLPDEILREFSLPTLESALNYVHRPPVDAAQNLLESGLHPHQQRLAFEELLAHQLSLNRIRNRLQVLQAPKLGANQTLQQQFLSSLPFSPTAAQMRSFSEINEDLQKPFPMLRLLQGDVGSGKTLVAMLATLQCVEAGYQVALMAPTEILVEQHCHTFAKWLSPLNIELAGLTGGIKGKNRQEILQKIVEGQAQVVVGTHALFQKEVEFKNLALMIVDEQHRFGVHQRFLLRSKGVKENFYPHQLIMTATPIPRTLAMTAYGDLNCSTIDELPPGRTPVKTIAIPNLRRSELVQRVRENCLEGKQAYWVCTLIEESEVMQCQAAEKTHAELKEILSELRIGLIHGRLKSDEKEQIMSDFKAHRLDLLVATTVIEVGVDVPNAALMIIENAERLGLAQLHQLRGRVGRGAKISHCVLMYQGPLSSIAKERLAVLKDSHDGFVIAQKDLELRGPGEVLGTRQTGLLHLKIANLIRDQKYLPQIQKAASFLIKRYPHHVEPLVARWLSDSERFGEV